MTDESVPTGAEAFALIGRVLDVERTGETTFAAQSHPHVNRRIYGGQVLAQSLIAAGRTVASDRYVHSLHGYFLRPGDPDVPLELAVEVLHDGRSFSARRTHAVQDGVPILSLIASFQEDQEGFEHAIEVPPDVPAPEELPSSDDVFRSDPAIIRRYLAPKTAFDIRSVEPQIYLGPDPSGSPVQATWVRAHGELPAWAERSARAALLAYACDQVVLEPVLRAHGMSWSTPGLSVASLDHAMWWRRDVDVTQWLLFVQASPTASGGRGLGTIRVYDGESRLVATIAQEGMVRLRDAAARAARSPQGPTEP
ncbi:acyl-CoA thioesterase II [Miniimonas sp. S16]|uniref:acyl-CoA thioesterase n=1 Tax=Miniimonas sp. S16 TaxID=2171623 RepID=UPI001F364F99|nr:acyl-CoA thioesterase II [Miniimonas sp. S16]